MTEQMAIKTITDVVDEKRKYFYESSDIYKTLSESVEVVLQALNELQQYRAIGTVKEIKIREAQFQRLSEGYLIDLASLREYRELGTIEEFQALKEKSVAKKPIFIKRSVTQFYA